MSHCQVVVLGRSGARSVPRVLAAGYDIDGFKFGGPRGAPVLVGGGGPALVAGKPCVGRRTLLRVDVHVWA